MESIVARAFKSSSFSSEVAMRTANLQALGAGDDYSFLSPVGAGEDFSVDEFFDLKGLEEEEEEEEEEEKSSSSSSSSSLSSHDQIDEGSSFSGSGVSGFIFGADVLAFPGEDMKELELWSHLMDDTISDDVLACPTRNGCVKTGLDVEKRVRFEPESKPVMVEATRFPPPISAKTRSKRPRTASGAWSNSAILKPDHSLFEPGFSFEKAVQGTGGGGAGKTRKPYLKKPKRKPAASEDDGSVQQRRCTHCQVQKTPQWRTGPLGPKTLCNACGVRFKSGRLFPEYRPACSPTFSSEVHSNSHRKVLEMRKNMCEPSVPVLVQQF